MDREAFRSHLIWAEGWRNYPYTDSVGKTSIGAGRNLDDVGLSDQEIDLLLANDIERSLRDARSLDYWADLSDSRKLVVADLCFNLGLPGWKKFLRANSALARGDWDEAADELVDSKWYRQTGRRARKIVQLMREG